MKTLAETVQSIKARTPMYFSEQNVEHLYSFLLGWDAAKGSTWCLTFIAHLAQLKRTGSRMPSSAEVPFAEALEELEKLVTEY